MLIVAAPGTSVWTLCYAFIYVMHIHLSDTIVLDDLYEVYLLCIILWSLHFRLFFIFCSLKELQK